MDRIINVQVNGHHLSKDNNTAGARGEYNVTILRITFDASWIPFKKAITFWDAHRGTPVGILLNDNLAEKTEDETEEIYCVPIPQEPLLVAGKLTFVIDGVIGNKKQRSVSCELVVEDSLVAPSFTVEPTNPTLTLIEQLRLELSNAVTNAETAAEATNEAATNAELYAGDAHNSVLEAIAEADKARTSAQEAYDYAVEAIDASITATKEANRAQSSADEIERTKDYIYNYTANAVKGSRSGEIIRIDDVSPTMQWSKVFLSTEDESIDLLNVGIKRYGKNMFDPTVLLGAPGWEVDGDVYYGLKVELATIDSLVDTVCFKPNTQYTLSFCNYVNFEGASIISFLYDDNTSTSMDIDIVSASMLDERRSITSEKGKNVVGIGFVGAMDTIYFKDIQLEVGDTATEYMPFVAPLTHKRDNAEDFYTSKVYESMRVTTDEEAHSARNDMSFATIPFEEAGKYKLRFTKLGGDFAYISEVFANCLVDSTQNIRFQVEDYSDAYCSNNGSADLRVDGGGNPENTIFQNDDWVEYDIEIPIAGAYEIGLAIGSYVNSQQTIRVTVDETCLGAYMLYPCTTLLTDTVGVSLTCIYNRDTNKSMEDLAKADGTNAEGTWNINISGTAEKAKNADWAVSATGDDFNNSISDYVYDITLEDTTMTLKAGNGWEKKTMEVATPDYVDGKVGSIETALDNIIAIQNTLIGGESV